MLRYHDEGKVDLRKFANAPKNNIHVTNSDIVHILKIRSEIGVHKWDWGTVAF